MSTTRKPVTPITDESKFTHTVVKGYQVRHATHEDLPNFYTIGVNLEGVGRVDMVVSLRDGQTLDQILELSVQQAEQSLATYRWQQEIMRRLNVMPSQTNAGVSRDGMFGASQQTKSDNAANNPELRQSPRP